MLRPRKLAKVCIVMALRKKNPIPKKLIDRIHMCHKNPTRCVPATKELLVVSDYNCPIFYVNCLIKLGEESIVRNVLYVDRPIRCRKHILSLTKTTQSFENAVSLSVFI